MNFNINFGENANSALIASIQPAIAEAVRQLFSGIQSHPSARLDIRVHFTNEPGEYLAAASGYYWQSGSLEGHNAFILETRNGRDTGDDMDLFVNLAYWSQFDFNEADGTSRNLYNLTDVMLHEILHGIGFSMGNEAFAMHVRNGFFMGPRTLAVTGGAGLRLETYDWSHTTEGVNDDIMSPYSERGDNESMDVVIYAVLADMGYNVRPSALLLQGIVRNDLTVLVAPGVVGANAAVLRGVTETLTATSHTLTYNGVSFPYASVDHLFTTVIRNGHFTEEFVQELVDISPSLHDVDYRTAVQLVGVNNIDSTIIRVAGADGNFVA